MTFDDALPFVDQHTVRIDAPRPTVWSALREYLDSSLVSGNGSSLTSLLGTEPRAGFEVAAETPGRKVSLSGRHRFSRYLLEFEVADLANEETLLTARTSAEFPGVRGRAYRALVIGSGVHVLAVRRMLRSVRRRSLG